MPSLPTLDVHSLSRSASSSLSSWMLEMLAPSLLPLSTRAPPHRLGPLPLRWMYLCVAHPKQLLLSPPRLGITVGRLHVDMIGSIQIATCAGKIPDLLSSHGGPLPFFVEWPKKRIGGSLPMLVLATVRCPRLLPPLVLMLS